MQKRSLKISPEGKKQAKKALKQKQWSQEYLAGSVGCSYQPVWKFFNGKPVDRRLFIEISDRLGLDWQEIVDLSEEAEPEPEEKKQDSASDIDTLVQKVRALCQDKIQYQCGTMQLLDVSHPVELDNLFVDVNILEDIPSQRWERISERLQDFDPGADEFDRFYLGDVREERVSGLEAAAKNSKLMVLGQPGSGKTTFLKHLAIECNKGKFQPNHVPIFIGLKRFTDYARNNLVGTQGFVPLQEYISQELQSCDVADADVESLLKHGRVLILLDGLDEVSELDSEAIRQQMTCFFERYFKNHFAITCRTQAQQYSFGGFTYVEVADFNQKQIEVFAKKWFVAVARKSEEEGLARATEFIWKLNQSKNKRVRELAVTPILLSLTCLVFNDLKDLPTNRSMLYEQGLDILLKRWDESRGIQRDEVYCNLSLSRKIKLLSQVAAITFERGEYFFEQDKIQQLIADYLCTLSDVQTNPERLQLDSEALLKSIEAQHGLLIERAREIYSFSHLTFQEYLTAKKFVVSSDLHVKMLIRYITNERWREVFFLAANMSWNPESLLLLKQQIDTLIASDDKLQQFLDWVSQKSFAVEISCKLASVRAFYFSLVYIRILGVVGVIHAFDLVLNTALDYAFDPDSDHSFNLDITLDLALCHALYLYRNHDSSFAFNLNLTLNSLVDNTLDPDLEQTIQQLKDQLPIPKKDEKIINNWLKANGQSWINQLRAVMIKHRNIGHNWQFAEEQKTLLKQYYFANNFLVNCLNSSEVSPAVRQEIEDTLLLPSAEIEKRKGLG